MTLVKAERTGGIGHWGCVVEGEGEVDTRAFGPQVLLADPNNPHDLVQHLDMLESGEASFGHHR